MHLCVMQVDKSKTVLIFKHKKVALEVQERAGRRYFDGSEPHVLHVGRLPRLVLDVARSAREGDVVWLWALNMIVVDRRVAEIGGAAQITMFIKTLAANRAMLVEGSTGRTTATRKQTTAMIEEAHSIIARGNKRLPATGARPGRKKALFPSSAIEEAARKLWLSTNIASDMAAIREAKETWPDVVTDKMMRNLGPSGRQKR